MEEVDLLKMSQKAGSVNKNALYNTIKSVAAIVFPLITFPYITRVLLTENVGKVNFGNSIISYFSLIASLGITTYAVRECSKCRDDKEKLSIIASEIFSLNIITTIISYLFLTITLVFFKNLESYRLLIVIQSMVIVFTTLGTDWLNNAMEDFGYITVRTLLFQVVSLVLMLLFVKTQGDYIKYAVIVLVSNSGAQVTNIFYRRKYCRVRFTRHIHLKKHLGPVMLLFSMQLAMVIYVNSDITMLGIMKGDVQVGLYSVSVKVYNIIQTLVTAVQTVLIPQLAISYTKKDYTSINRLLRYGFNFMLVLGLPCLIGINIIAEGAVVILSGEAYMGSVLSLRILTVALLASFMAGYLGNLIMLPSGRDTLSLVSSCISALLNIVLNLILIPQYGLNAAAFTTFVSMLAGFFIKLPFVDKTISFDFIKKDLWTPLLACALMAGAGYFVGLFVEELIIKTLIQIAICVTVYLLALIIMKNEFLLDMLDPIKRRIKRR